MQKKQKAEILIMLLFLVFISGAAVAMASDCRYFGQVKEAMRAVRRLDNLHYTYYGTVSDKNSSEIFKVEVWADQLTGSWQAEYSMTDEDGEWPFLRRYCDGKGVYEDKDWDGEWESHVNEDLEVPNMEELTILPYSTKDIAEETMGQEGDYIVISHVFTVKYATELLQKSQGELEQMWNRRSNRDDNGANEKAMLEQYQQTDVAEAVVTYWIDKKKVLRKKEMSVTLLRPQMESAADGTSMLGEEEKIFMTSSAEVLAYNENISEIDE